MSPAWIGVAAAVGLLLGPALRAVVFHHSVESGQPWRRHCPGCGRAVRPGPLPPGGRCPDCRVRIGPPPYTVELAAAAVLALLAWRIDRPLPLLAFSWVFLLGIALSFVDAAVHRLPDRLTLPAAAGGLALLGAAAVVEGRAGRLAVAVICALGVAAVYLVLVLVNPAGMGLGDAKTALSTGLVTGWFGWSAAVSGAMAGFILAGGYAVVVLLAGRAGPKDDIPHGPFMLLGAFAAVLLFG